MCRMPAYKKLYQRTVVRETENLCRTFKEQTMYQVEEFENQAKKQGFILKSVNLVKIDGVHYVKIASTEVDKENLKIIWDEDGKAYCNQIRYNDSDKVALVIYFDEKKGQWVGVKSEDICTRNETFDLHFKRVIEK